MATITAFQMRIGMKNIINLFLFSLFIFTGCAQKEFTQIAPELPKVEIKDDMPKRQDIVKNAMKHLNKKDGGDCSGFVSLVNQESNEPYFQNVELNEHYEDSRRSLAIYNLLETKDRLHQDKPKIGDLVFFANTVKKYSKSKSPDNITHIGIVTKVDSDETVHFIHNTRGRNIIGQMNLAQPHTSIFNGKIINSYMEKCSVAQSNQCLSPAYFSAYGVLK